MDAENPNTTGTVEPPDFSYSNRKNGLREWASWLGYQIQGSMAYADDPTGAKIYAGSDIGSMYVLNAADGTAFSVFTVGGNVPASPAIWEGKMYCGCTDGKMYCFDDSPIVDFSLYSTSDKGTTMWNNETITMAGRLTSNPTMSVWSYGTENVSGTYIREPSDYHPGLPNATIKLSLTTPGGDDVPLTATTDNSGYFSFSYSPTEVGEWGWVVYYDGMRRLGITYNGDYGEWNAFSVTSPVPPSSEEPETGGLPMEVVYAAIAVIVIVVVVLGVYMFLKRK